MRNMIFAALAALFVALFMVFLGADLYTPGPVMLGLAIAFAVSGLALVVLTVRGDETGKLRSFLVLTGACAVAIPVLAVLHNFIFHAFFFILALLVLPAVFLIAWVTSFVLLATAEKPVSTGRKVLIGGFFALALAAIARVTIVIGGDEPYEITSQVLGTPQEEMPDLRPGLESFVPDNIMHVSLEPLKRTHEERYEFLVGTDLYVGRGTGAPGPAG